MKAYKYYMTIADIEINVTYEYEVIFLDHFEADMFLIENESVGNTIIIHKYKEIEVYWYDEINNILEK